MIINDGGNVQLRRTSSGGSTSFNFSDRRKTTVTADTLGVGETDADKSNANGVNLIFWKRIYSIIKIGYNSSPISRLALETYVLILVKIMVAMTQSRLTMTQKELQKRHVSTNPRRFNLVLTQFLETRHW